MRTSADHAAMRRAYAFRGPLGVVRVLRTDRGFPRFAPVVSKKVGHAVTRNRVKRRMREIFRKMRAELTGQSFDLVATASPLCADASQTELERWIRQAFDVGMRDRRTPTR